MITKREVAERLGIDVRTVDRLRAKDERFPRPVNPGSSKLLWRDEEVERYRGGATTGAPAGEPITLTVDPYEALRGAVMVSEALKKIGIGSDITKELHEKTNEAVRKVRMAPKGDSPEAVEQMKRIADAAESVVDALREISSNMKDK